MSNYYDYYKNERKIPGILALILVGIILSIPFFFLKQKTRPTTSFGASNERNIVVTPMNVTATSVDLFWKTAQPTVDTVTVWDIGKETVVVNDVHDVDVKKSARRLHFFSLHNLKPNTEYFISIQQNEKILGSDSNPYSSFTTLNSSAITTSLPPVYGKIVDDEGKPQGDVLLVATVQNAGLLGGFTKTDGSFLVSLCCLYDKETREPLNPARDDVISIQFENEQGKKALVSAPIAKASPLQEALVIGRNTTITHDVLEETTVLGSSTPLTKSVGDEILRIYYPKDSAVIPGKRPLVKGTSIAMSTVKISFPKQKRSFEVKADAKGNFELSTPFDLTSGNQTVVAQSKDAKGKLISVTQSFSIPKSGETVLGEATGSAQLSPTLPPSLSPTLPLSTATPVVVQPETPTPTLLPTGIDFGLFSMMSAMLILFGLGIILIF